MIDFTKRIVDSLLSLSVVEHKSLMRAMTALNVALYRASGGRLGHQVDGCPVCLATITGRKTGKRRTLALMYVTHGDEVLLVASLGGSPKNPLWYDNLCANPAFDVQIGRTRKRLRARVASDAEHAERWPVAVAAYPSYAEYQARTSRRIPILICTPLR